MIIARVLVPGCRVRLANTLMENRKGLLIGVDAWHATGTGAFDLVGDHLQGVRHAWRRQGL